MAYLKLKPKRLFVICIVVTIVMLVVQMFIQFTMIDIRVNDVTHHMPMHDNLDDFDIQEIHSDVFKLFFRTKRLSVKLKLFNDHILTFLAKKAKCTL